MSFNKRYFSISMLREAYKCHDINYVIKLFNTDAMFFKDNESKKVYTYITNNNLQKAIKILNK